MERKEVQEQINHALNIGDWYDISHLVKADISGYALYYLATLAIKQRDQLNDIIKCAKGDRQ